MTSRSFAVLKHDFLRAAPSYLDPWLTYGHISCDCENGDRLLLLYLRPDGEHAAIPANTSRYDAAGKVGVLFFHSWQFAVHSALFGSGRRVQIEFDDAWPRSARIDAVVEPLPPGNDPVPDVRTWVFAHANVEQALMWPAAAQQSAVYLRFGQWPMTWQQEFQDAFAAAWNHRPMALQDPPTNLANWETDGVMVVSADDAWQHFCAHTAYCLAMEIGKRVPWSITGYTASDLKLLLHGSSLFSWNKPLKGYTVVPWVVPSPPEKAWTFLSGNGLVGKDRVGTIANVLDWCRNNLQHCSGGSALLAMPFLVSSIIQARVDSAHPEYGACNYTQGCTGTTHFLISLLRTLNIVVEPATPGVDHALTRFTTDDLYLSHGDDPYNRLCKATPAFDARLLLIDRAKYDSWFGVGVPRSTASNNVGRRPAELALEYPPDWLLNLHYQDRRDGKTPQTGEVYKTLQQHFAFTEIYPQLWQRMDARLADMGSVPWPPCAFYDFDLLSLARAQLDATKAVSLPADALENNNSFDGAAAVSLAVDEVSHVLTLEARRDEQAFDNLNFSDASDVDYFAITYACPGSDDAYRDGGAAVTVSRYLGLSATSRPAALAIAVRNARNYCVDMQIYQGDRLNRTLYKSLPRTSEQCIENPTHVLGGRECYLVLRNTDYVSQGAFSYDLRVAYTSACCVLAVDFNAPAYRAEPVLRREILKALYDRIDLPRPPDLQSGKTGRAGSPASIDGASFIDGYQRFLESPGVATLLGRVARKPGAAVIAEELGNLAALADAHRLSDRAERHYLMSARNYAEAKDGKSRDRALGALANMHMREGRADAAAAVRRQVSGPVPTRSPSAKIVG